MTAPATMLLTSRTGEPLILESVSATNLDKIIMAVSTTVKESEWSPQQVAFA